VGIKQLLPDLELNLFCAKDQVTLIFMLPLMFADDLIFAGYTVDSVFCCIDLHCCKPLRKQLDVVPPSSVA
jgi:hypothetical protein